MLFRSLKTEEGVKEFVEAVKTKLLPLMPKEFWFGARGGDIFTPSYKVVGSSDNPKLKQKYKDLYNNIYLPSIRALRNDDSIKYGKPIEGVNDYSVSAYSNIFKNKDTINKNIKNNYMLKLANKLLYVVLFYLIMQINAYAVQEFIIEDIRVEGLQRITPGTVFNYLPMKVGDTFDDSRSSEAVRALFKTGFFKDVRLERDGGILVFILVERPAIGSITLIGNEDIRSEDLIDSLRQIGFAEGRAFDRSQLEKLEQELKIGRAACRERV